MKKTIFLDFDGVVRFWSNSEIHNAEAKLGVEEGTLFKVAFSEKLLIPAITGIVSDELWRKNVESELAHIHGEISAETLMFAWQNTASTIDYKFLDAIQSGYPESKLIMITNATTRLTRDLEEAKLNRYFESIVNSSEIGFAKPNSQLYRKAIDVAGCNAADCLFIDDSAENVLAAQNIGIASKLFTNSADALQFIANGGV